MNNKNSVKFINLYSTDQVRRGETAYIEGICGEKSLGGWRFLLLQYARNAL